MLEIIMAGFMALIYTWVILIIGSFMIELVAPGKIEIVDKIYRTIFELNFGDDEED